ncbi:hypothetical protein BJX99DRAFT_238021 [Aspergillus californicus]
MVAPDFLSRLFKRAPRHRQRQPLHPNPEQPTSSGSRQPTVPQSTSVNTNPYWSRALLDSPGITPTSCEINGDPNNPNRLPIPPNYTSIYTSITTNTNPDLSIQDQSPFFTHLPPEVRQIIYTHAFGGRRIHLDFDFTCTPQNNQGRWSWWHRVCDDADNCPEKEFPCPETEAAESSMLQLGSTAWVKEEFQYKIDAMNWLRCCKAGYEDSLPVLYSSNTFVLSQGIDQLFRLTKTMPAAHLDLLTSMSVEIDVYRICAAAPPDMDGTFKSFYVEFFEIIERRLPNLKRLSLSIAGIPQAAGEIEWEGKQDDVWVRPWEGLARSRRWKRLDIAVPGGLFSNFEGVVERRGGLDGKRQYVLMKGLDSFRKGW